jgi:RHS repeat-associated protein
MIDKQLIEKINKENNFPNRWSKTAVNEAMKALGAVTNIRRRLMVSMMTFVFCLTVGAPEVAFSAQQDSALSNIPAPAMPKTPVHKGFRGVKLVTPKFHLSADATDAEITTCRIFQEPLIALSCPATAVENHALATALTAYSAQKDKQNVEVLKQFMATYPNSRWTPSLKLNVAELRYECGYMSEALDDYRSIWEAAKAETGAQQKSLADEAFSKMMLLDARLGKTKELTDALSAVKTRPFYGSNDLRIKQANASRSFQTEHAEISFKCGPFAVNTLLYLDKKVKGRNATVDECKSTSKGTNLWQVKTLADKVGLKYQAAKRKPGSELLMPAVVHLKQGHFATITQHEGARYRVEDPTFDEKGSLWVNPQVFDEESDGYFLVPNGPLPSGWTQVGEAEAESVWGKGTVSNPDPGKGPGCPKCGCPVAGGGGPMTVANAFMLNATLNLMDTPVSYQPPVGNKINFTVNYNDQEGMQPATFTFSNFGQDWSINWGAYLTVDASQNVTVRTPGGGYEIYNYNFSPIPANQYAPNLVSQAVLSVASVGVYQRMLTDGSIQVFNQPDGTGRIFMTQLIDPQANSTYIQYDANFRILTVTDCIGQVSNFSYVSNTVGNAGFYLISQIVDPFGRAATFAYDPTDTFLLSITDVIGLVSQYVYDTSSSTIHILTTPYGTTSFTTQTYSQKQFLRTTYPDGTSSIVLNAYGGNCSSYYWDREAMMLYPFDYQYLYPGNATETTGWMTTVSYIPLPVANTFQRPLENLYTYTVPGESVTGDGAHNVAGPINKPSTVSVSTGSGGTQTYSYQYNSLGKTTQLVDPLNRTFSYLYAVNNIDLLEKRQTQGSNNDLNGKWIYNNTKHLPNKYIDGSGRATLYTYNNFGQLLTLTDANGDVWTRTYNADGFLIQIDGPLPGTADATTFAYDGFNRLYSVTDSEGYSKIFSYDNADRITQVIYPDTTTEQTVYNKLDAVMRKDRIGRWTQDTYTSMDQLSFEIDPLGRKTEYTWCACGSLSTLTDGNGNVTTFNHDQEGRLTQKTYSDGTAVNYTYDGISRLSSRTDALGQQTFYAYNLDNTLSGISYIHNLNPTSNVSYTWDPNYVRLSTVANGWGTYTYTYNPYITDPFGTPTTGGGMLATVLNSAIPNATTSYLYDVLGRTSNRQINGSANSVTWNYDQMSRVTSETNVLGTFGYHYVDDISGSSKGTTRLASINYPNGQITNFSWYGTSQDERLQGITNLTPSGQTRSQFNYAYDSAGEITQWPQQNAGISPANYALGYDPAGQLVSAQSGFGNPPSPAVNQNYYAYDAAANRTSAQSSTIQTARIAGTITSGNTLTITVQDPALSGGQEVVNYTVLSTDTLATIATKLAAAITADANLRTLGVNASATSTLLKIRSTSPNITTYTSSTSGGATETITLGVSSNIVQNATISLVGANYQTRASDVLKINVFDSGLSGGTVSVTYTVPSTNTAIATVAAGLAAAMNANSSLSTLGVTATSASGVVSISSSSTNLTTYSSAVTPTTTSGTETVTLGANTVGNTTATIGGTVTVGDVVSLTIRAKALANGSESVTYLVPSGATTTTIATGLKTAIAADSKLVAYGVTATSSGAVVTISSTPIYTGSTSGGATETITLGSNVNGNTTATIGGTITAGNTVSLKVSGAGLASARTETYTVLSTDTLATIAAGLAALVNADTTLKGIGVTATSSGAVVSVSNAPINYPLYIPSVTGGATETIALAMNNNSKQLAVIGGTITSGDTVSINVSDFGLSGGTETDSYTVTSSDTPTTIATGLTAAINADIKLQAIGVSATSSAAQINLNSLSPNVTTYNPFTSATATESISMGFNQNGTQTIVIGGTKRTGDILTITSFDAGLTGGKEATPYTVQASDTLTSIATGIAAALNADTHLSGISVTATSSSNVVFIKSASTNLTTYQQSVSSGATETLGLSTSIGGTQAKYNKLNQLIASNSGGDVSVVGSTNKPVSSVSLPGLALTATPPPSYIGGSNNTDAAVTYTVAQGAGSTTNITMSTAYVYNDEFWIYVNSPVLPGGTEQVTYNATSNSIPLVIAGLASAINGDTKLQAIGVTATASGNTLSITDKPTYSVSTNVGATETVQLSSQIEGNAALTIGGTPTVGDTLNVITSFSTLTGGTETTSYTVITGDTLASIATKLVTAVNADSKLVAIGVSSNANIAALTSTKNFNGNFTVPSGATQASIGATDGGGNQVTNNYQLSVNGPATQALSYDLNGNLVGDGTNTYVWDAENRLIQINYPGTGNNSQFTYDGEGHTVAIIETTGGTVSSTKQFVRCKGRIREARDSTGAILSQYFSRGQTLSSNNMFYAKDHLGSTRDVSNSSGTLQVAYSYDSFGRVSTSQGTGTSDFQYAGYYHHAPSDLYMTLTRMYSSRLGRWINRDSVGERGGINLYAYVANRPTRYKDPLGTATNIEVSRPFPFWPFWPFWPGIPQPAPTQPHKGKCSKDKKENPGGGGSDPGPGQPPVTPPMVPPVVPPGGGGGGPHNPKPPADEEDPCPGTNLMDCVDNCTNKFGDNCDKKCMETFPDDPEEILNCMDLCDEEFAKCFDCCKEKAANGNF